MEPNAVPPVAPQPVTPVPDPEIPSQTPIPKKPSRKFILILVILALLIVVGLVLAKTVFKADDRQGAKSAPNGQAASKQPKAVEQVFVNPVDGTKKDIKEADYYTVTIDTVEYYGHVNKINDDYIRLLPTAYKKANVLTFTGKELHGPEAATYFRVSKVTKLQELTDTTTLAAVKAAEASLTDAFPTNDINKYIKSGQMQAYFFADGKAFFAKTTSLDGAFLAGSQDVYYLRTNASSATATDISLVHAKPEEYNTRTSADLLYWQNMKADSQIAKAVITYEQQNPNR